MEYDKRKVLTPFTTDKAKEGDYGWFADAPKQMEQKVGKKEKIRKLRNTRLHSEAFVSWSGLPFSYFYPAPYNFAQEKWVEEVGLKVDDKVRIKDKRLLGDIRFPFYWWLFNVGDIGIIRGINREGIIVFINDYETVLPYFFLEKIE